MEFYSEEKNETLELSLEGGISLIAKGFNFQPEEASMDPFDLKFNDFAVFATQKGQSIYARCILRSGFQQCLLEMGLTEEECEELNNQEESELTITIAAKDQGEIAKISDHFNSYSKSQFQQ